MEIPTVVLNNGREIPKLGLGTYKLEGEMCTRVVREAIAMGYCHIDTAVMYENHEEIGRALSEVDRDSLFITSKVPHQMLEKEHFLNTAEKILRELKVDYLDLLLIHWPNKDIDMEQPLLALRELLDQEKIAAAGVSNFTEYHLRLALGLDIVQLSNNQIECHPYLPQEALKKCCDKLDIVVTGYSPLARGDVIKDPTLMEIALERGLSAAEVSLRWLLQRNIVAIPKASSLEHLKQNINVFSWSLSEEEMSAIDNIPKRERKINPEWAEFDLPFQR